MKNTMRSPSRAHMLYLAAGTPGCKPKQAEQVIPVTRCTAGLAIR
jgi:hypothetical protein